MKFYDYATPYIFGWRLALHGGPQCLRAGDGFTTCWLVRVETRTHVYNVVKFPYDRQYETWRGYLRPVESVREP